MSHAINDSDLVALTAGNVTKALVGKLTAAESGKHRLLVEAVRRQAMKTRPEDGIFLDAAIQVLVDIEAHSPHVVADLLALPQVGGWAVHCLRRMRADGASYATDTIYEAPLRNDLGYLASIAATAALRTRHFIDLLVPLRNNVLLVPGLGTAKLESDPWAIARVRFDSNGAVVSAQDRSVILPTGRDLESHRHISGWTPISRLHAQADGLALDVTLDWLDPFLLYVGESCTALSARQCATWELRLREAWQLLVRHCRATAQAFAASVSTFVPLAEPASPDPKSATSGWTFGAIGLSLPGDAITLAETLIHEFQHLLLGAIEDLDPLVVADRDQQLGYAPWRDDPRPAAGLLHGCYAYFALTAFWRRQRRFGVKSERFRSAVEFARWRSATFEVARSLADSPALTMTGLKVATDIRDRLAAWQGEHVTAKAERFANDMRIEHRARWRINNLLPAHDAVEALARAWVSGQPAVREGGNIASVLGPSGAILGQMRAFLLELRHRNPMQIRSLIEAGRLKGPLSRIAVSIDKADTALLLGDDSAAARGYLRRLDIANDTDAFVGLAIALQRLGPPASAWILSERPEVVAAVHIRLRTLHGTAPDTSRLVEWLAECFA